MHNEMLYKVVVVDDEELLLNSLIKKVNSADLGFEVIGSAKNGSKALELIEKLSPDVIITDIKMPVMDGIELLRKITSGFPEIIKIIVSGFDDFKYAQEALKCQVKDYILKPLNNKELMQVLNNVKIELDIKKDQLKKNVLQLSDNHVYSPEEISRMLEVYIKENYTQKLNFDAIAHNFNFSLAYLSKIFTKHIGMSPSRYLTNLRINKAKHLLLYNKELSVKEIGELAGYCDQFYFSRIFKMFSGKSPAAFREDGKELSAVEAKDASDVPDINI